MLVIVSIGKWRGGVKDIPEEEVVGRKNRIHEIVEVWIVPGWSSRNSWIAGWG